MMLRFSRYPRMAAEHAFSICSASFRASRSPFNAQRTSNDKRVFLGWTFKQAFIPKRLRPVLCKGTAMQAREIFGRW